MKTEFNFLPPASQTVVLAHKAAGDGSTLALLDLTGKTRSRKWGVWRNIRLVKIEPGATYVSTRSTGCKVIKTQEYDARGVRKPVEVRAEMLAALAAAR